jgi:exodeoxyribonuclease VII large subunit
MNELPSMNTPQTNLLEFTVSELSFAVKRLVEGNFEHVRVRGEISGFKGRASSGHCYFTLKDSGAAIDAVVFRLEFDRLRFKPQEGLEVVATGRLTTFPTRSRYQIVIEHLEPAGAGALMALLEERRKKLAAEGLFDAARKKAIPYLPTVIGVVTSPTGAVIRDILHRLRDRFPRHVLVWPVRVQGEGAAEEVAAAVHGFNAIAPGGRIRRPELLIVARGGGSIEDLWAFNEEVAVRAVAASVIPIISAVGHETDWTLIDHAADLRAPTPTGAAEMAVPVRAELMAAQRELASRHELGQRRAMENRRRTYLALCRALPSLGELHALPRQKLDDAGLRLSRSLRTEVEKKRQRYMASGLRLSPAILKRADASRRERLTLTMQRVAATQANLIRTTRRDLGRTAERHDIACVERIIVRHRERYLQICRLFQTLKETVSPDAILARGFAIVLDPSGGTVRSPEQVATGDPLLIKVARGSVTATVTDGLKGKTKRTTRTRSSADQDSLL